MINAITAPPLFYAAQFPVKNFSLVGILTVCGNVWVVPDASKRKLGLERVPYRARFVRSLERLERIVQVLLRASRELSSAHVLCLLAERNPQKMATDGSTIVDLDPYAGKWCNWSKNSQMVCNGQLDEILVPLACLSCGMTLKVVKLRSFWIGLERSKEIPSLVYFCHFEKWCHLWQSNFDWKASQMFLVSWGFQKYYFTAADICVCISAFDLLKSALVLVVSLMLSLTP